ncbi:DUF309 domain-containing protein [Aromatoleum petrolei]|uniref:DUF309 domain-containing protein n=1 Tax=Aromatoleum petrolei TaxID=76116 RepID=A0ABX1MM97_9RHOO|nr:DUF309 domain-containing protein [Aromatoleum petrolei]NMF89077.1 DUF309 domain-containing protein [Aromatoleum petrolei]QTQ38331.1 putative protein DUF309 [Aromatoleum petrolei]
MLLDLQSRPILPPDRQVLSELDWSEIAALWNGNELSALHDLLNARWSRLIRNSVLGAADPEAEFLQGLAFAALALFFTQHRNQEGALILLDDAVFALGKYRPRFLGVQVEPIVGCLQEMRPLIASLPADGENPSFPFVYAKFEYDRAAP